MAKKSEKIPQENPDALYLRCSMEWFNAALDTPRDQQLVLISVNGIYYNAIYDEPNNMFTAIRFDKVKFSASNNQIYWSASLPPKR